MRKRCPHCRQEMMFAEVEKPSRENPRKMVTVYNWYCDCPQSGGFYHVSKEIDSVGRIKAEDNDN